MSNVTLMKLVRRRLPSDEDLAGDLAAVCEIVRVYCGSSCPIYALRGKLGVDGYHDPGARGCGCYGDGKRMLKILRRYYDALDAKETP